MDRDSEKKDIIVFCHPIIVKSWLIQSLKYTVQSFPSLVRFTAVGTLEKRFVNTFGIFFVFRVLYVCRLFNGLEQSIIDEEWSPTGVPTIFRMIDKMNSSKVELKLVLTVKDGFSILNLNRIKIFV